jgi:hypothetical protein
VEKVLPILRQYTGIFLEGQSKTMKNVSWDDGQTLG